MLNDHRNRRNVDVFGGGIIVDIIFIAHIIIIIVIIVIIFIIIIIIIIIIVITITMLQGKNYVKEYKSRVMREILLNFFLYGNGSYVANTSVGVAWASPWRLLLLLLESFVIKIYKEPQL